MELQHLRQQGVARMFGWIQRLVPKSGDFFALFEAHAATLVSAADALQQLAADGATTQELLDSIQRYEHEADDIIREVLREVRLTFLTPFDRGAITDLIAAMDDAIDEMLASARAIDLYGLRELRPEMKEIVGMIAEQAAVTSRAVPLLRKVSRNAGQLHELTRRLVEIEGDADDVHAAGLKRAFREFSDTDPMQFAVSREVFKNLERVTDAFEDVANEIDGIVIDHA